MACDTIGGDTFRPEAVSHSAICVLYVLIFSPSASISCFIFLTSASAAFSFSVSSGLSSAPCNVFDFRNSAVFFYISISPSSRCFFCSASSMSISAYMFFYSS